MPRIIAIDYGKKRIGIATTYPEQIIATALATVPNSEIIKYLKIYLHKENVQTIVVGHPKHLNNKDADLMTDINAFIKKLKKHFPFIKIELFDERFTSKMAKFVLVEAGYKKKTRQNKENLDKISATILLQDYMQSIDL